jgi:hypothetical protein
LSYIRTDEIREKNRRANLGRLVTSETREKISKAHLGMKHTPEAKAKIGLAGTGEKNGHWKGGGGWSGHNLRVRDKTIVFMGGKCVRCGFSDHRALQIDHINGGGSRARRTLKLKTPALRKQILNDSVWHKKYQLLCANCNWIKRWENNELSKSGAITDGSKESQDQAQE